jgi:predicted Zn-dependent protease
MPHAAMAQSTPPPSPPPVLTEDNEVRIGRENAELNDKSVKLVTDAVLNERVNRIGQELAAAANKYPVPALWGSSNIKQFKYVFKIVDDKDVNAYSLPGGFIYINRGLLDYIRSDDELAGVLAHEITHAAHHHMVKLMHEQNKINNLLIPAMIGVVALSHGGQGLANAGQALYAGQLYAIAKVNTYGIEAEKDADHGGMMLMTHTRYNPVGLYSVMLRFAQDEQSHIHGDYGIFQTHPPGLERSEAAHTLLVKLNVPITLSAVDPTFRATVAGDGKDSTTGVDLADVKMKGVLLCRISADDGLSASDRADRIAKHLTSFFDSGLQPFEIRISHDQSHVLVRGYPVLSLADANAQRTTMASLCHDLADAVSRLNQRHALDTTFSP